MKGDDKLRKLKDYKPTKFMAKTSYYDEDAADFAVAFIESLCHTKGTWAGKHFELIDWQEKSSETSLEYLNQMDIGNSTQLMLKSLKSKVSQN